MEKYRDKNLPGGTLKEIALAIHELAAESRHLVLHLPHLGVETFPYVGKFGVDDAKVAQLDGNVAFDTTIGHVFSALRAHLYPLFLSLFLSAFAFLGVLSHRSTSKMLLLLLLRNRAHVRKNFDCESRAMIIKRKYYWNRTLRRFV